MNEKTVDIPCPLCQTKIPVDTMALLTGTKFTCPNPSCDASVGLAAESKNVVKDTMEKFEEVKKGVGGKKG
jgi:hypothetical protein